LVISKTSRSFTTCGCRIILCRWYSRVAIRTYEALCHCDQLVSTRCTLHATCGAQRQCLYFCTSKASKLSLSDCGQSAAERREQSCNGSVAAVAALLQYKRLRPVSLYAMRLALYSSLLQLLQLCCSRSTAASYLYFCASKASKLGTCRSSRRSSARYTCEFFIPYA
jgi:hypothetical protein